MVRQNLGLVLTEVKHRGTQNRERREGLLSKKPRQPGRERKADMGKPGETDQQVEHIRESQGIKNPEN